MKKKGCLLSSLRMQIYFGLFLLSTLPGLREKGQPKNICTHRGPSSHHPQYMNASTALDFFQFLNIQNH